MPSLLATIAAAPPFYIKDKEVASYENSVAAGHRWCSSCKCYHPLEDFDRKKSGNLKTSCRKACEYQVRYRAQKRAKKESY